jgi:threonine dehydrogenase-like Zn-dependent dehydrogenase
LGPGDVVVRVAGRALGVDPPAEISGTVVEAGEAAREWLDRRVVVPRALPCGDCDRCRRGRAAACAARAPRREMGTHETVPARFLCSVEPPLWPSAEPLWRLAALADAAAAPFGALVRAGLAPGELVAVIGGGVRGAFAVAIARAKGAHAVLIDADPERRARAISLGAAAAVDALEPSATAGELARVAAELGAPLEIVLETTASTAGRHRALAMLPPGATAVFLDGAVDATVTPPPDWPRFAVEESRILGASACHPDLYPELCALVVRGELPLAPLCHAIAPAAVDAALADRRAGRLRALPIVALT